MKELSSHNKTRYLVEMAVLVAVLLMLEITNLGYLKFGLLEMTIMQVPVIIGAIVLGPAAGAVLGGVFGLTSFWQCFGKSAFGVALFAINPIYTFIICVVGRVLMGWLTGLIYKGLQKVDKTKMVNFFVAGLSGALLNTAFFMGFLVLLFGQTDYILGIQESFGATSALGFIVAMVGVQGILEAVLSCVLGAVISKAVLRLKHSA
ncbi:MAG: ECF transporter S component [Eubacteriales bacterium]